MAREWADDKHGAERIPPSCLTEVKRRALAHDWKSAAELLDQLCTHSRLKSFEAYHLATHLYNEIEKERSCKSS
jgi:hypothetical protein